MFEFFKTKKTPKIIKTCSCDAIANRIVFFGRIAAYCSNGNPSQQRAYPIIYPDFTGADCVNINELKKHILRDKKNLLNGIIPKTCTGCGNLSNRDYQDNFDKSPEVSYIQFSDYGLCNSKCIYCNSWTNTKYENGKYMTKSGEPDSYEIMPLIKKLIKGKILTKNTTIDFAGGEPTIYRQFEEALQYLIKFGIKNVLIFSNCINYSESIEKGLKEGLITLTVSVDAGSKEIHEKVKGVKSYNAIYENLKKYTDIAKNKENIVSKYVVVPEINDSIEEIEIWIKKSFSTGIKKLIIDADNRIFEKDPDETVINKLKILPEYFIKKCKEINISYGIYSNMQYISNFKTEKKWETNNSFATN